MSFPICLKIWSRNLLVNGAALDARAEAVRDGTGDVFIKTAARDVADAVDLRGKEYWR